MSLGPRTGLRGTLKALAGVIDRTPLAAIAAKVRPGDQTADHG
jgi:hypothetical protein